MTTPDNITSLQDNQVFVFGSNLNGNHAGGAAKLAADKFGAKEGVGEGMTGQCYAFPTLNTEMKKVSAKALKESVAELYKVATDNKDKEFLITKVGCGIAGFTEEEMKQYFDTADKPNNVVLPAGWSVIRGYKAFEKGLKCRDFQYEFDKDFYHEGKITLCKSGFHFCKSLGDVYNYYQFGTDIVVCEVETEGDVIDEYNGEKSVTNHLRLVRMLNAEEAANNSGRNCTGHSNTGDWNTGHSNTGDWNTGHRNTGHSNTGHSNTGDWNTGDWNTGHSNTGDWNTGHSNTGDWNTGDWNTGDWNTGHSNTGDWNTGHSNTGHRNTGHSNTGHRNTGHSNTGDWNTGHSNTGDWNTGDWNIGHRNTGHFNTITPDEVLVFNKPCSRKVWEEALKPSCLHFSLTEWIDVADMSDEEKKNNQSYKTTGGYLKKFDYKEAFAASLAKASKDDIKAIKALPNFDADVFEEISGFRID